LSHALNNTLAAELCFLELQLRPVNDNAQRVNYRLSGHPKTGHLWPPQNRPLSAYSWT
jgi:hypothetical protein